MLHPGPEEQIENRVLRVDVFFFFWGGGWLCELIAIFFVYSLVKLAQFWFTDILYCLLFCVPSYMLFFTRKTLQKEIAKR